VPNCSYHGVSRAGKSVAEMLQRLCGNVFPKTIIKRLDLSPSVMREEKISHLVKDILWFVI
jgi:hypothetical protein